MRTVFFVATLLPCLVTASLAEAHIQLMSPTARYIQDDNGLKAAPCGSGTKTGTITPLVPGQTLTVTWKESVSHAGHFRIALSANQSDFVEPTSLAIPTTLPSWDLADGIQDKTGNQTYDQTVQIPNVECPACVLQVIQVMSTGTDGTNTGPFSGVYHACADLNISTGNGDGGTARDAVVVADARPDVATRDNADDHAVARDTAQPSGGTMGMGGNGSGDIGVGGSAAGTGGSTGNGGSKGSGGSGSGGASAGAGGATSKAAGGSGDGRGGASAMGNGGTAETGGGVTPSGGSTAGGVGGVAGGNGSAGGGRGGSAASAANGNGGAGSGDSGSRSSGGAETPPSTSANGCSCRGPRTLVKKANADRAPSWSTAPWSVPAWCWPRRPTRKRLGSL